MSEREVLLRVCEAYGGDPCDPVWHSVKDLASLIEGLSGQVRGATRDAFVAKQQEMSCNASRSGRWNQLPRAAEVCGLNPHLPDLFPAKRLGCGEPIATCREVYRCTECLTPFHRECAEKHFGLHATVRTAPDEIAWLVEYQPYGASAPKYFSVFHGWTSAASEALRFARSEDGHAFRCKYLADVDDIKIIEHLWCPGLKVST